MCYHYFMSILKYKKHCYLNYRNIWCNQISWVCKFSITANSHEIMTMKNKLLLTPALSEGTRESSQLKNQFFGKPYFSIKFMIFVIILKFILRPIFEKKNWWIKFRGTKISLFAIADFYHSTYTRNSLLPRLRVVSMKRREILFLENCMAQSTRNLTQNKE